MMKRIFATILLIFLVTFLSAVTISFAYNEPEPTLESILYGDVNGDGDVTQLDAFYLARHIAEWDGYEADKLNYPACDVNLDGKVTQVDSFILARHLAEWEGYETLPYINTKGEA